MSYGLLWFPMVSFWIMIKCYNLLRTLIWFFKMCFSLITRWIYFYFFFFSYKEIRFWFRLWKHFFFTVLCHDVWFRFWHHTFCVLFFLLQVFFFIFFFNFAVILKRDEKVSSEDSKKIAGSTPKEIGRQMEHLLPKHQKQKLMILRRVSNTPEKGRNQKHRLNQLRFRQSDLDGQESCRKRHVP